MNEQEDRLIYSFPRNEEEEYQINLRKFKGRYYTDLRLWFKAKGSDSLLPKKKGISLEIEAVPELLKGFHQLMEVCQPLHETGAQNGNLPKASQTPLRDANARSIKPLQGMGNPLEYKNNSSPWSPYERKNRKEKNG